MFNLLKKDLLLQKRANMFYMAFIIFFLASSPFDEATLVIALLGVTYIVTFNSFALEEKSEAGIFLNSLPLKRATIVLSKYVMVYVLAGFVIGLKLLLAVVMGAAGAGSIIQISDWSTTSVLMALIVVTLMYSFNLPIVFKFGYLKSRFISTIVYFVLFFGTFGLAVNEYAGAWLKKTFPFLNSVSMLELAWFAMIPVLFILVISIWVSISFYSRRELA
ncbi:ABC-2 transporter permease [Paenibacillus sp. CAU 1782]